MRKIIFAAGMMSLLAACGNTGNTQTIAVDDTQNYDERKADSLGIPKGNKLSAAMKRAMKSRPCRDLCRFWLLRTHRVCVQPYPL